MGSSQGKQGKQAERKTRQKYERAMETVYLLLLNLFPENGIVRIIMEFSIFRCPICFSLCNLVTIGNFECPGCRPMKLKYNSHFVSF